MNDISAEIECLRSSVIEQGDYGDLLPCDEGQLNEAYCARCAEKRNAVAIRGNEEDPTAAGKRDARYENQRHYSKTPHATWVAGCRGTVVPD